MDKLLVTGVAGFIGSRVARRLLDEGHCVVGVDDLSTGIPANVPAGVEFIQGNLALATTIGLLPRDCRAILHLAGQSSGEISFDDPVGDLEKNVVSTLNLIRFGIESGTERLLYASSMGVYGSTPDMPIPESHTCRPLSCYGVGKLATEHYLQVYNELLPSASLRMFNVYGPGQDMGNLRQGMVSIYLAQAVGDGRIEVRGSAQRFRDFVFIDDVVDVWSRSLQSDEILGRAINVGTGIRTTVQELLNEVEELIPEAKAVISTGTPGDQNGIYADVSQLQSWLGPFEFTPLRKGLGSFLDWVRTTGPG